MSPPRATLAPPPLSASRALARVVVASLVGWTLAATWVAWLTLRLNPQLHGQASDRLALVIAVAAVYLVVGAAAAAVLALPAMALARRAPSMADVVVAIAAVVPVVFAAALPDSGVSRDLLPDLVTAGLGARLVRPALTLGGATLLVAATLAVAIRSLHRWPRALPPLLLAALVALPTGLVAFWPLPGPATSGAVVGAPGPEDFTESIPAPVVLLCVDGADLDDVVVPMAAAGELPTFGRLMAEGVSGPLASLDPGLSAVIWTTLVTGVGPEEHGIHHFLHVQLPGMTQSVREFPLMAGLNFHLLALAEDLPGMPALRHPYTSDMRRRPALWELIGTQRTVGLYRWLITWPVEPVNGFAVGESVVVDLGEPAAPAQASSGSAYFPPEVEALLAGLPPHPATEDDLARFLGCSADELPQDPRLAEVGRAVGEPTLERLIALRERFRPDLTLASFFSVDSFNHLFARERGRTDTPFAGALAARYRQLDRALGELVAGFDRPTNRVIVSDHGYDFAADHHVHGPPGLFLAAGPGFRRGARVDGLSVLDVTPLILRLLGAPLVEDLPGTRSGAYAAALDPAFAAAVPERRSAGPTRREPTSAEDHRGLPDDRVIEQLRRLGYLE